MKRISMWLLTLLLGFSAYAQSYTLKGVVQDQMDEPLIGVSVRNLTTNAGVVSDIDGNFQIAVKNGEKVEFSYVGYISQTIDVKGQNDVQIILAENSENLNEVVVIGYGTARKKDLTGAVVQISPEKLADQNPSTVQDLLRGTAGLQIGYNPDAKGASSIQLRGQNSLYTDGSHNSPLIILDGMQFNGELSEINPDDIAAIDVLKDASSAAIYGAKAASGVIIITTKKGKQGKPVVTVTANISANTKSAFREVFGPDEYLKYREDYYKNETVGVRPDGTWGNYANGVPDGYYDFYGNVQAMYGITPEQWANSGTIQIGEKGTLEEVYAARLNLNQASNVYANFLNGRKTVDWYDLTFRTGFNQDYNGSVSGATENVNYYFSVGYLKNEGAIRGNDYESMRASMKINAKITPWLEIGANANFQNRTDGDIQVSISDKYWEANMLRNSPFASYRKEDGSLEQYPFNGNPTNGGYNYDFDRQYLDLDKGYTVLNTIFNAQLNLPYNITYRFNIAPRLQWFHDRYFMSAELPNSDPVTRGVNRKSSQTFDWTLNNTITWDYYFNKIHHVTVMLGQEAEENRSWADNIEARHITPTDALGYHYISGANKSESSFWTNDIHITAASYFGRVFYGYDDRYMFTATVRRDGYSAFGANDPWANFWSAGASWRLSEEKFMESTRSWLNDLKIRADYGETGNQDFSSYMSLNTMSGFGYYLYNGKFIQVWGPSKNVNPNLRWEKGKNWNVGIDFAMFNNRFSGSLNYFNRRTQDLLGNYKVSVPPYLHDETFVNVGTMKNTGFEFDLSFNAVQTKEFDYNFNVIGTTMSNKFVDFSNSEYVGQDYYSVCGTEDPYPFYNLQRIEKGESVGNFFMWRYAGINEDGEWLVYDKDGDIINAAQASEADRQKVGNGMPKFTLSTTHNFRYRNFDLSLFFRGAFGFDIFNIHDFYYGTRKFTGNVLKKAYGKNFAISPTSSHAVTDYFLERGDYFKLDQITLGYTLNIPQCRFLDKVRLYGTMKNVFTITRFSGVDPSNYQVNGLTPGGQGSRSYFPSTRQFILGVQLDF